MTSYQPKYQRNLVTEEELADLLKRCQQQRERECDSYSCGGLRCQLDKGHAGLHQWHCVSGNRMVSWDKDLLTPRRKRKRNLKTG